MYVNQEAEETEIHILAPGTSVSVCGIKMCGADGIGKRFRSCPVGSIEKHHRARYCKHCLGRKK